MTGRRSHGRDVTVARRVSRGTTMVIVLGIAIAGIVGSPAGASVSRTSLSRIDSRTAPKTSKKKNKKKNKKVASEAALRQTIRAHGLTAAGAKQLFALDIGPLPGVSIAGIKRDDANFDGTTAVGYVYAEWSHLTPAQKRAVKRFLTPSKTLRSTTKTTSATSGQQAILVAARTSARAVTPSFDYLKLAEDANLAEGTETGAPGISGFVIGLDNIVTTTYAETRYYEVNENNGKWTPWPDGGCHITVFENKFEGLDPDSAAAIIAHEVFHCYQQRGAGLPANGKPNYLGIHDWIGEGEATWVMAQLHPDAPIINPKWQKYTSTPETKYFDRRYDALGLYGHLGDVLGGQTAVWPLLLPVNNAGIGGEDSKAWNTLIAGVSERYYNSEGASYYQNHDHIDWHMGGPGTPPSGPPARSVTIGPDDGQEVGLVGTYQAAQTDITSNADILIVTLASGYGKAHDQDYKLDIALDSAAPLDLCLNTNECKCPDGSAGASEHTIRATSPISLGLEGGEQHLAAYAAGESLDKYCKKPDPQPPAGPPPSGGGAGGSNGVDPDNPRPHNGTSSGDPHLATFDGLTYDLQTVGEMTLVQSTTDDFTVQVRTTPIAGSNSVAVDTAVATRIGGHRLTIAQENGAVQARLDGVLVIDEVTRVGGGTLQRIDTSAGGGYVVEWPDGTIVRADAFTIGGLNVTVAPSTSRAGKLTGLLGNDDGRTDDDYATGAAQSLGATPTRDALNTTYTNSWRVTPATSLFDYGPGQSTTTFTDLTFPHANVDASNAPNRATVEQQCRDEGITDKYLLQDCILDASAITDYSVLSHYSHTQTVASVRSAIAHGLKPFAPARSAGGPSSTASTTTTTGPVSALRTIVDAGRVNDPSETVPFTFPAHAGDVIWISTPDCDTQLTFALVAPNGKVLNQDAVTLGVSGCQAGRFELPADGNYQLIANADKKGSGNFTVPIRFQRRDVVAHAAYGQKLSGNIPQVAAHDVYLFDAHVGDLVHISGPGCDIGPSGNEMTLNTETADGKPAGEVLDCSSGRSLIQRSGTYEIVVNFANHGPGSYSFVLQK